MKVTRVLLGWNEKFSATELMKLADVSCDVTMAVNFFLPFFFSLANVGYCLFVLHKIDSSNCPKSQLPCSSAYN